jgi:glycosyltransferase involved in cell wall biosynthesis
VVRFADHVQDSPRMNAPLRVLALTRYGSLGASSRLRTVQYRSALEHEGVQLDVWPLLPNHYLERLYATGRFPFSIFAGAYLMRMLKGFSVHRYDLLWIEKELFPWLPEVAEDAWLDGKAPFVVDYDDAIFHHYDRHRSAIVRKLLGGKIDWLMRRSRAVIAGNPYLAARALSAGAREVNIVPTVISLERYRVKDDAPSGGLFTVGWIGTPRTVHYLDRFRPILGELVRTFPAIRFRLVAIGLSALSWPELPVEVRPWSEATEVEDLRECDVGIMPLDDDAWSRGKCGYKIVQYFACGLPVVASAVGVNRDMIRDGENGFLAEKNEDWIKAFAALCRDPALCRRLGHAGRRLVAERYCVAATAPVVADILRRAV